MQDVLRSIWSALGVPQLWGLVLTLAVVVAVAIIKLFIDQAMKNQATKFASTLEAETNRQTEKLKAELQKTTEEQKFVLSQYASIATYTQEQYQGLLRAYIDLFEGEGKTAARKAFAKIASKAYNDVKTPFDKYQYLLDEQTRNKIYSILNILDQFRDNPSPEAIELFRSRKAEFFANIDDTRKILQPEQILKRKGIISSVPYEPHGG
jgi:hypothetical protein